MALTEKELKKIADIQDRINRGVKIQENTQKELDKLIAKQVKEQQKLNKEFQLGAKAQRQSTAFAEKEKKLLQESEKSFSNRIQNLVKGNFLQAAGLDKTNAARKAEISLAQQANSLSSEILTKGIKENENRVALQDLTKDIVDGAIEEKSVISERINGLNIEEGIKNDILRDAEKLFDQEKLSAEELGKSAKRASFLSKALGIAGVAFGLLVAAATKFASLIDKVGETFGSLTNLGDDLTTSIVDASTEVTNLGFGVADVNAVVSTLSSEFGVSLDEAANLSAAVLDTAKATGLSVDEATKLTGELRIIAGLSQEQSEALIEGTAQLARQAGVAPQQVLKDIAASSETIAIFTKDSGENLFEAAVQARQFGLNIDSVAKAARSTLDFESSINAELEASALLGTQINLQRARQLALDKDLVGFQKEIKNQLSDVGDFNELNVFQQESLAKAVGMSVSEVAKLASGTEKLSIAGALSAGSFDDLAGQDALSQLSQLTGQFKELTTTFLNSLGPVIMDVVKDFNTFLANEENIESLKGLVESLASSFKFLGSILSGIVKHINVIVAGFSVFATLKFASLAAQLLNINKAMTVTTLLSQAIKGGPLSIAATVAAIGAGLFAMSKFNKVDDFKSGPGGITHMTGPAGSFKLNPKDSVLATTNSIPVNDVMTAPAGGINVGGDSKGVISGLQMVKDAITNLNITAGRGEIRVAMEPQMGGNL